MPLNRAIDTLPDLICDIDKPFDTSERRVFVSGYGRGSVIPLEYQGLATDLAEEVNGSRPGTVKLNYGYVSRSDDMLLSLNARCLGLTGVMLENAHTTEETVAPADLAAAVRWISAFIFRILNNRRSVST